jgi:hypothetical protein
MITSPARIRPASCAIVSSVILPAGSMTHTVRGPSPSVSTSDATDNATTAPSFASAAPAAALAS